MIVLCLEGCHGCGKTELCNRFEQEGFEILDEAFLDMPSYGLHPQSLLMETTWIVSWFERLLKNAKEITDRGGSHENMVYVADRSPYSAVFYCNYGHLLEPIIEQHIQEVREFAGIEIVTTLLGVEKQVLWERIQQRLEVEPDRALYKEDSYEWMEKVDSFYNSFKWDHSVDNTEEDVTRTLTNLMCKTIQEVCSKNEKIERAVSSVAPKIYESLFPVKQQIERNEEETKQVSTKKYNAEGETESSDSDDFGIPENFLVSCTKLGNTSRITAPP